MPALSPETRNYINELARRLDTAGHGQKTALVEEAADFLCTSKKTIHVWLRDIAGRMTHRKTRSDKGATAVAADSLLMLASTSRESIRDNGKQTLFTTTARGMLENNGHTFGCSTGHLNRLIRNRKMNVRAQSQAAPVQQIRALYPNYLHEIDPSLCLVYYLRGTQYIIRDREFYKNKLEGLAKVKFKVYRYVLYDRASGVIIPWYVEAAGENYYSLFDFLMYAWGKQDSRLFHGVGLNLLWDKGSANTSHPIKNLLWALGVNFDAHAAGAARVKGGVENGNNIVETQFESRLRFEPVGSIDQLNAAAAAWAEAYNANLIPGQDTRLHRRGLAEPVPRYDLWQMIRAEQLRVLPPVEVCRAFMQGREELRQVKPSMAIHFKHPAADRSLDYSLRGLPAISVGDEVKIRPLIYGEYAIQIEVQRYDGEPLLYRVEPELAYDKFGQALSSPVAFQEYRAAPDTDATRVADVMDALAYPGQDAKKARDKKQTPFNGALDAHSYLRDIEHPTRLQRQGQDIVMPDNLANQPKILTGTAALFWLADVLKRSLTAEENAFLSARYADGVTEDQLQKLAEQFKRSAAARRIA